jgi:hypothetical protein
MAFIFVGVLDDVSGDAAAGDSAIEGAVEFVVAEAGGRFALRGRTKMVP